MDQTNCGAQKAAIYVRVSTQHQAGSDKVSIPQQIEQCLARAVQDNFLVPNELIFTDEGISGALDREDRPAFHMMLKQAEAGHFERLYFYAVDRLGRDQAVIATALRDLKKMQVEYVSLREPQLSDPLYRALVSGMVELEHALIRERTYAPKMKKFREGYWVFGEPPFGYQKKPDLTLEPCASEAEIVRRIFADSIAGRGRTQTARRLNALGFPPPKVTVQFQDGSRRKIRPGYHGGWGGFRAWLDDVGGSAVAALEWQHSAIQKILTNTMMYGQLKSVPMKITPAPIITLSEFLSAQEKSKDRRQKGKAQSHRHLLTGLIFCGSCGQAYRHKLAKKGARYWACGGRRTGKVCRSPYVRHDAVMREVLDHTSGFLFERLSEEDLSSYIIRHSKRQVEETVASLSEAQSALSALQLRKDALNDDFRAARSYGLNESDISKIVKDLKAVSAEYADVERRTIALTQTLAHAENGLAKSKEEALFAASFGHRMLELSADWLGEQPLVHDLRRVLELLIDRVTVNLDRSLEIKLKPAESSLPALTHYLAKESIDYVRHGDGVSFVPL